MLINLRRTELKKLNVFWSRDLEIARKMVSPPRVAIVGGGLAGSLCALVLRMRGARPIVIDSGKRAAGGRVLGGRGPDSGVQVGVAL